MKNEQLNFSAQQEKNNDRLLDELNFHLKKIEEIKTELLNSLLDKSDSEHKIEQQQNISIVQTSFENPLMDQLKKEEAVVNQIKSEMFAKTNK